MTHHFPPKGLVFWPVGNGDSTSIIINDTTIMQVDLNHMESSNDDDDTHTPIIDRLVEELPKIGDVPYLAAFVLKEIKQKLCLPNRR